MTKARLKAACGQRAQGFARVHEARWRYGCVTKDMHTSSSGVHVRGPLQSACCSGSVFWKGYRTPAWCSHLGQDSLLGIVLELVPAPFSNVVEGTRERRPTQEEQRLWGADHGSARS